MQMCMYYIYIYSYVIHVYIYINTYNTYIYIYILCVCIYIYNVFTIRETEREIERITYIYIYHPIPVSRSHLHIDAPCGPLSIARSEGAAEPQCHISSHGLVDVSSERNRQITREKNWRDHGYIMIYYWNIWYIIEIYDIYYWNIWYIRWYMICLMVYDISYVNSDIWYRISDIIWYIYIDI